MGRKFVAWTSPASRGITQTMNRGISEAIVSMVDVWAVRRTPHHQHNGGAEKKGRVKAHGQILGSKSEIRQRQLPNRYGRISREEDRQQITGAEPGADREYRRPRRPIRPQR